jgi:3',5'-cyclic AMP phosphodiesterase CpdA
MKRLLIASALLALATGLAPSTSQAPANAPFFFLQFSDPQFGMFTADNDFAQETANFEFAIASANRLKPAFVVVTGDLVNKAGDPAQIAEYQRIAAKLDRAIPLYNVAGNHDVGNTPTPETVAAYTKAFGPDHYTFKRGDFVGIVINSSLVKAPEKAGALLAEQEAWMKDQVARGRQSGARHIVIFQHHPYFLKAADEVEGYYNLPLARRGDYLRLFRDAGVKYIFAGHFHNNSPAQDGDLAMVTSGPVGKPLGPGSRSGMRVVIVRPTGITHQFYELGDLPTSIDVSK